MLADVLNSHAGAGSAVAANGAPQWIHILAGAIWLGGLFALLLERGRAVHRFSAAAGVALLAVATTCTVRAVIEIGAWDRLWSTTFGELVVAKALLLLLLAGLGAVNRYRNVPAAARAVTGLRRVGRAEVTVAVDALLATACTLAATDGHRRGRWRPAARAPHGDARDVAPGASCAPAHGVVPPDGAPPPWWRDGDPFRSPLVAPMRAERPGHRCTPVGGLASRCVPGTGRGPYRGWRRAPRRCRSSRACAQRRPLRRCRCSYRPRRSNCTPRRCGYLASGSPRDRT
jgi:uncharacterized membrane protein